MRDDISKLPIPASAKKYARQGAASLMGNSKGPNPHVKAFQTANAELLNAGKPDRKVVNYDVVGQVPHAIKGDGKPTPNRPGRQFRYSKKVSEAASELIKGLLKDS